MEINEKQEIADEILTEVEETLLKNNSFSRMWKYIESTLKRIREKYGADK